jgi:hypothetical protein
LSSLSSIYNEAVEFFKTSLDVLAHGRTSEVVEVGCRLSIEGSFVRISSNWNELSLVIFKKNFDLDFTFIFNLIFN